MIDPDFIEEEVLAVHQDGTRSRAVVRVGKPYEDDGPHVCVVQILGIGNDKAYRVFGEGPMQALHLGLKMLRIQLELAESRGIRFYHLEGGADAKPSDWRCFWFGGDPKEAT